MPYVIPLNSDSPSTSEVSIGSQRYIIRTYFNSIGSQWFVDILNSDEEPLLYGVPLSVGYQNLLIGNGDLFEGIKLVVGTTSGENRTSDSLGNTAYVLVYTEDEESPIKLEGITDE